MEVIQRALASSVYPDGLDGRCAARYVPESGELWVEYELPRQQVVPAITGYRYVKSKDLIQSIPRKDAETSKLYEKLIARVAVRTLAEAFDVARSPWYTASSSTAMSPPKTRRLARPSGRWCSACMLPATPSPKSSWTSRNLTLWPAYAAISTQ